LLKCSSEIEGTKVNKLINYNLLNSFIKRF
jgi:hypothetical protein